MRKLVLLAILIALIAATPLSLWGPSVVKYSGHTRIYHDGGFPYAYQGVQGGIPMPMMLGPKAVTDNGLLFRNFLINFVWLTIVVGLVLIGYSKRRNPPDKPRGEQKES